MQNTDNFYILSLDGGGLRGIFTAALLEALEDDLQIKITDHFDLIAGTSTGGIIAVGLGLGLSPKEILSFYRENANLIFPWWRRWLPLGFLFVSKYSNKGLIKAAQKIFQNRKFGESKSRLVITSYSLATDNVYLFRTAHHERLRRDYKVEAWKTCVATASAPTFFPAFRALDNDRLIDGGVWANNPSMVAIVEAINTIEKPLEKIHLCSIGTTVSKKKYSCILNLGTKIPWAVSIASLFLNGQRNSAENHCELLLGQRYQRINFTYGGSEINLDSSSDMEDLFALARSEARKVSPKFKSLFASRKSPEFNPIYRN